MKQILLKSSQNNSLLYFIYFVPKILKEVYQPKINTKLSTYSAQSVLLKINCINTHFVNKQKTVYKY